MRLVRFIVTFCYIGHAKIAPGSIASLVTTLIFYLFAKHLISYLFIIIILITIISAFFAVGIYTYELLEKDNSLEISVRKSMEASNHEKQSSIVAPGKGST